MEETDRDRQIERDGKGQEWMGRGRDTNEEVWKWR